MILVYIYTGVLIQIQPRFASSVNAHHPNNHHQPTSIGGFKLRELGGEGGGLNRKRVVNLDYVEPVKTQLER